MKRFRGDVGGSSHHKRSFGSSRGESYGQSQAMGGGGVGTSQKLTTTDALFYLKEVKEMFHDQKEKYDMFLEVMKDKKAQRTDTAGVIARVKELFKGHNNLIIGFNTFLPKGYEITLDENVNPPVPKKTVEFEEAISFVNKIKRRFQNDESVYKSFLDILNMYRKEHKDIVEVSSEVSTLFEDHPDLLEEFTRFLPEASVLPSGHHGRNTFQRYQERYSAVPTFRQVHTDKLRHQDLSVDHPELEEDKATIKLNREQRRRLEKKSGDRRVRDQDGRDPEHGNRRGFNTHRFSEKRKAARKVEGFGASYEEKGLKSTFNYAATFFEKVKEKLGSLDDYQSFLKCLNLYNNGIVKRSDLHNLVTNLLGTYPDLMNDFNVFLERCGNIDGFLSGVINKKSLYKDGRSSCSVKVEDRVKERKHENEVNKEKEKHKDKYMGNSVQELDLSSCVRCTPSYCLLPHDYPISSASQRTELGAQVLNDSWVSVTFGSEDYSFKHMRKNQYEESLFRCEDDRFELDMLLESVSSTTKRVLELLNSINGSRRNQDNSIRIEDYFTAVNLRCIERLYGEHGIDVVDQLRKSPTHALPIILSRLNQKLEEWMACRSNFNKIWADVYVQNHYKSLDHRSFYFKQQDSKNLSTKSLVAEINDLKEKREKENDLVIAVAARDIESLAPHLVYEYLDIDIHEDLYKLVKFSCEEVCSTKEQFKKVMKFWATFLEPMMGVPSRPDRTECDEDVGKVDHMAVKCPVSDIKESNGRPDADDSGMTSEQVGSTRIEDENAFSEQVNLCRTSSAHQDDAIAKEGCPMTTSDRGGLGGNEDHELKTYENLVPLSKDDVNNSVISANGTFREGMKVDIQCEEAPKVSKVEKEEGELSPNGDYEEDNTLDHGETTSAETGPMHKLIDEGSQSHNEEERCDDANNEDSENVPEAGEDVSASESARDDCSREDHEEEDIEHDEVDGKAESQGEAEGMAVGHFIGEECESLPVSEHFLISVKPLVKRLCTVKLEEQRKDCRIFYGNDDFFVLFRLHQILYERILLAKKSSMDAEIKSKIYLDACAPEAYLRFQSALYNFLDGSIDDANFEEECRALTGNQSYILFTLDKLIYKLVKQLQTVADDEMDMKLSQLYLYEKSRSVGKFADSVYCENARVILHEQNTYRFEFSSSPYQLSIQLMDNKIDKPEMFAVSNDPNFTPHLYNDFISLSSEKKEPRGILLQRNKRKYASLDELSSFLMATEGVQIVNGLECKIACSSSKVSYVLDTEDYYIRKRRRREHIYGKVSSTDRDKARLIPIAFLFSKDYGQQGL